MCRFLTNKHAEEFRPVSRSIRIYGHSTSLRLEACFWRALDDFARDEGLTTPKLIETLHSEASNILDADDNAALNLASPDLFSANQRAASTRAPIAKSLPCAAVISRAISARRSKNLSLLSCSLSAAAAAIGLSPLFI
jgi:predicted DNA-binding ribbon-helix-helix protein